MKDARERFLRAEESAGRQKLIDNQADAILEEAEDEVALGYSVQVQARLEQALKLPVGRRTHMHAARIYAFAGNEMRAREIAGRVASEFTDFEPFKFMILPQLQAQIALRHHNPQQALDLLKPAAAYDGATPFVLFTRASAYLQAGRGPEAAQEFQRVLKLRPVYPLVIFMPLAQLGLARSFVLSGEKDRARTAYQDLFAQWKDADPDLPVLRVAHHEYDQLVANAG
jgi:predicted Zn-dependent protease